MLEEETTHQGKNLELPGLRGRPEPQPSPTQLAALCLGDLKAIRPSTSHTLTWRGSGESRGQPPLSQGLLCAQAVPVGQGRSPRGQSPPMPAPEHPCRLQGPAPQDAPPPRLHPSTPRGAGQRGKLAGARRPREEVLMGGRVGAARLLAHVTPVRARLTTAAPGDAGALRSPGAPPGNVSISCRLLPAGARAPSRPAEPSPAAGSSRAPPQVGEVPRPPRGSETPPSSEEAEAPRQGARAAATPGASGAAGCSPRPGRPRGAGGRFPSAGRECAVPHKLC